MEAVMKSVIGNNVAGIPAIAYVATFAKRVSYTTELAIMNVWSQTAVMMHQTVAHLTLLAIILLQMRRRDGRLCKKTFQQFMILKSV
jgi:hypothetical protein